MHRKYIFRILRPNRIVIVEADNVRGAMEIIEKKWYPGSLDEGFEVVVADGMELAIGEDEE